MKETVQKPAMHATPASSCGLSFLETHGSSQDTGQEGLQSRSRGGVLTIGVITEVFPFGYKTEQDKG